MSEPSAEDIAWIAELKTDTKLTHGLLEKIGAKCGANIVPTPLLRVRKASGVKMEYSHDNVHVAYKCYVTDGDLEMIAVLARGFAHAMLDKTVRKGTYIRLVDYRVAQAPTKLDPKQSSRYIVVHEMERVTFDETGKETNSELIEREDGSEEESEDNEIKLGDKVEGSNPSLPVTPRKLLRPKAPSKNTNKTAVLPK